MIKLLENDTGEAIPVETLEVLLKVVPDRVRTILPGMIILYTLVKHFHSEWVDVTRAGVRDGYLYRYVLQQDASLPSVDKETIGSDDLPQQMG